jgi:hypothetical protein
LEIVHLPFFFSKGEEALLWVLFALDLKFHPWTTMSPPYTLIMRHKRERERDLKPTP